MRFLRAKETYIFFIVVFMVLLITAFNRIFFSFESVSDILRTLSVPGILALGVFLVLVSGGVDISFGALATVAMYLSGKVMISFGGNVLTSFMVGIVVGMLLGAINGLIVSKLKIPTIIATLGTFSVFRSTLILTTGGKWMYELPEWFLKFSTFSIWGMPVQAFFYLAIVIITWAILKYTLIGRGVYAVGGNQEAAFRVGFNVFKIQMFIYIYAGLLAGVAGVLNITIAEVVDPRSFTGIEFPVIAAVVLGGASIMGGTGTVPGTVFGSLFVAIMNRGLVLMRVSSFWHEVIVGLLIIISVSLDAIQKSIREKRKVIVSFE